HEKYVEENRIKQSKAIFEEVRDKLDKRVYYSRRLCLAINNMETNKNEKTLKKVEDWFEKYDNFIESWNCTLNKMISDTELAFGKRLRNELYKEIIIEKINPIGKNLSILYKGNGDNIKSWKVLEDINIANDVIHKFDSKMLNKIKDMEN